MQTVIFSDFLKSNDVEIIFTALEAVGGAGCLRFVGGCIRNALLDYPVTDIDLATTLTPDETEEALKRHKITTIAIGKAHGTICAIINSKKYEITSLRKDVMTDGRHARVVFGQDWGEDAFRRDFTINALYCDRDGQVFDPTGQGLTDIAERVIRFIGNPFERIKEDYLRILRFYRFSAQFSINIDIASLSACGELKAGINKLSSERVWAEVLKILSVDDPTKVIALMAEQGVLDYILPNGLKPQLSLQIFNRICQISHDPMVRFIGLIYEHGLSNEPAITLLSAHLRLSKAQLERIVDCLSVYSALGDIEINIDEKSRAEWANTIKRWLYLYGKDAFIDAMYLMASVQNKVAHIPNWIALTKQPIPRFPIGGRDLIDLGVIPGPEFKIILSRIEKHWVNANFDNNIIQSEIMKLRGG